MTFLFAILLLSLFGILSRKMLKKEPVVYERKERIDIGKPSFDFVDSIIDNPKAWRLPLSPVEMLIEKLDEVKEIITEYDPNKHEIDSTDEFIDLGGNVFETEVKNVKFKKRSKVEFEIK